MKTDTALRHFDNLELDTHIRVLVHNDEPWFVAKDICENLGIQNSRDTLAKCLDEDEQMLLTASKVENRDIRLPNRGLQVVSESGLYALIFRSTKPEAKAFRKWVTSEVLPAIRRDGRYDPAEMAARMLPSVRRAYLLAEIDQLERTVAQLRRQADLAQVIPGQMTVWQWLLLQGEDVSAGPNPAGSIGVLSAASASPTCGGSTAARPRSSTTAARPSASAAPPAPSPRTSSPKSAAPPPEPRDP